MLFKITQKVFGTKTHVGCLQRARRGQSSRACRWGRGGGTGAVPLLAAFKQLQEALLSGPQPPTPESQG